MPMITKRKGQSPKLAPHHVIVGQTVYAVSSHKKLKEAGLLCGNGVEDSHIPVTFRTEYAGALRTRSRFSRPLVIHCVGEDEGKELPDNGVTVTGSNHETFTTTDRNGVVRVFTSNDVVLPTERNNVGDNHQPQVESWKVARHMRHPWGQACVKQSPPRTPSTPEYEVPPLTHIAHVWTASFIGGVGRRQGHRHRCARRRRSSCPLLQPPIALIPIALTDCSDTYPDTADINK